MSDRDGSTFEPTPVSPGRGGRPLLVAGLVMAVVVGSVTLAQLSPAPDAGPSADVDLTPAIVEPTPTPVRVAPMATAVPRRESFSAPEVPIEDLLVEAGTARWLRLASARLTDVVLAEPGRDLLLMDAHRGTICLCWRAPGTASDDTRALDLVRRDGDAQVTSSAPVAVVPGFDPVRGPDRITRVAIEPSPDEGSALLVRTARSATHWLVSLDVIDLASASIVDSADLIALPQVDPSIVLGAEPPTVRIAPDGRSALIMAGTRRLTSFGPVSSARHAWVVSLDGQAIERVVAADPIADSASDGSVGPCSWVAFVTPTVIAKGCHYPTQTGAVEFRIRRYDEAGRDLGTIVGDASQPDPTQVLLDLTGATAYAWDPIGHSLFAADLIGGGWRSARPTSDEPADPGAVVVEGSRPPAGTTTTWSIGRPATGPATPRTLVGSPDGGLLFAIGAGPVPGSTSGIWVFDARTLRLLERWPALAAYDSITLFEDGRWIVATGRPGLTPAGGPAAWGVSVTIHDTATGRPVLRIGDVGVTEPVALPWRPMPPSVPPRPSAAP